MSAVAPTSPRAASRLPAGAVRAAGSPALPVDPRPPPEKVPEARSGGSRYGLWLGIFLALAVVGGAVAVYFLVLNK